MDRTTLSSLGDVIQFTNPGNYTVRDMTISGPGADRGYNSIEVREAVTLTVENTRLENSGYGLRLFTGARASSPGGLIVQENNIGVANHGDLTLIGTVFARNSGGLGNYGTAEVTRCRFQRQRGLQPRHRGRCRHDRQ